jgi:hypothetical protein
VHNPNAIDRFRCEVVIPFALAGGAFVKPRPPRLS